MEKQELRKEEKSCVVRKVLKHRNLVPRYILKAEIGPSGVRELPLGVAAERSVHYFWDYCSFFLLLSPPHTFLPEGFVVGFKNFAWGFKSQKK